MKQWWAKLSSRIGTKLRQELIWLLGAFDPGIMSRTTARGLQNYPIDPGTRCFTCSDNAIEVNWNTFAVFLVNCECLFCFVCEGNNTNYVLCLWQKYPYRNIFAFLLELNVIIFCLLKAPFITVRTKHTSIWSFCTIV